MEECLVDSGAADVCPAPQEGGVVLMLTIKTVLSEILQIETPPLKEYALAFQAAFKASWESFKAWISVLTLVISPLWRLLTILARAVWPHVQTSAISLWRFQASLPLSTLCAEAAAVTFVVLVILLRRFIVRRRYLPRAQQRIRSFRARVNRRYQAFTASVERNFRLSARAFPHVVYWIAAALLAWLAPDSASWLRDNLWVWATVTWPALYALYLTLLLRGQKGANGSPGGDRRELAVGVLAVAPGGRVRSPSVRVPRGAPSSPGEALAQKASVMPHDVDRVLMYWVVFTAAQCCSVLSGYLPFAVSVLGRMATPPVRTASFLFVVWIHLPDPGSGLQVVYAVLEPLVHKYVKDLRPSEEYTGVLARLQDLLVFLRVLTEEHAEVLADNIADSWMLLPVPLFFFTPSFVANLGCLYAGLFVPALNSIKTLGRRSNASAVGGWAALATPAAGARVRWLTYWVAYGWWWHVAWFFQGLLRLVPLSTHAQLALLLWLQVPVFRGAGRVIDCFEQAVMRWTGAGAGAAAAAGELQLNDG